MNMIHTASPKEMANIQYLNIARIFDMPVQEFCDMYQIYFQIGGKRYLFWDRACHTLQQGEVAVLKPFQIYYSEIRDGETDERYVLRFRTELLDLILDEKEKETILEQLGCGIIGLSEEKIEKLYDRFLLIEDYVHQTGFLSEKLLAMAVVQLIMMLVEDDKKESHIEEQKVIPPIEQILEYIEKNYEGTITLEQMAEAAGISKFYFCRMFRKVTGATPVEYINLVRLIHVQNLLEKTNLSVEEIAQKTGLSSSTNLARIFKKMYDISPLKFRKVKRTENT